MGDHGGRVQRVVPSDMLANGFRGGQIHLKTSLCPCMWARQASMNEVLTLMAGTCNSPIRRRRLQARCPVAFKPVVPSPP